jgi:rod shape determining protein RodA
MSLHVRDSITKILRRTDWIMFGSAILISVASLVTLFNFGGEQHFFVRQLIFLIVSIGVFFVVSNLDLSLFKNTHIGLYLYLLLIGILLTLFVLGNTIKGAQSWFSFGAFAFQPTDLMKIATIIVCAKYFSRRHVEIKRFKHILISFIYMSIPFLLIFLQPDFGSAIILFCIWFGMVILSGLSKKHLFIFFIIGLSLFTILWSFVFKEYQKNRIRNFINPTLDIKGTGYNAKQSLIAVGSGQILGKGIGHGTQSRLHFLPEYETDFIFAAYAEEWGFIGTVSIILLYGLLLIRISYIALQASNNFEILIALGIIIFFLSHIIVNIGMNIGIMPITGITLPFMSYGGSHLLAEFIALGMIGSIYRTRRPTHKDNLHYEFLGVE